jgi:hypothetical protein
VIYAERTGEVGLSADGHPRLAISLTSGETAPSTSNERGGPTAIEELDPAP